jgi:hypothetical protein
MHHSYRHHPSRLPRGAEARPGILYGRLGHGWVWASWHSLYIRTTSDGGCKAASFLLPVRLPQPKHRTERACFILWASIHPAATRRIILRWRHISLSLVLRCPLYETIGRTCSGGTMDGLSIPIPNTVRSPTHASRSWFSDVAPSSPSVILNLPSFDVRDRFVHSVSVCCFVHVSCYCVRMPLFLCYTCFRF